MVRGGRNAKPTSLKLLQGTARPDRVNANEPKPAAADLTVPPGLDTYGRQAWKRWAPLLQGLGILTEVDVDVLALLCDAYSQWRRASRAVRRIDPTSEAYRKVAVSVEKARDQMRMFATEFGMTPASRSRLQVVAPEAVDEFEEMFGRTR